MLENMRFFAGAYRVPPNELEERVDLLLGQMDLTSQTRYARRAAFLAACGSCSRSAARWSIKPPLLFLDEPTSGLDPVHRQQMWDLLYELSHGGITDFRHDALHG